MNFLERMNAVLHHRPPDQVPFAPQDNHLHRGDFERDLRNRGVGLFAKAIPRITSERPNVRIEIETKDGMEKTYYHTPVGTVWTGTYNRVAREIASAGNIPLDGMIKSAADYPPVLFMIEDTVYHVDNAPYYNSVRDLGVDGIGRSDGFSAPYASSRGFFGGIYGLDRWIYAQYDERDLFWKLVEALERRSEHYMPLIVESPSELISIGDLDGDVSPEWCMKYKLPFYQRWVPELQAKGHLCMMHAHASNLASFVDYIRETGVDIIEAFTPPPVGNLSLADARKAWGREKVIWVNFPESIFWEGAARTKQYTIELLRSDAPGDALAFGFTEMGQSGIHDDETERVFKAGIRAIMEAIEEQGNYPIS